MCYAYFPSLFSLDATSPPHTYYLSVSRSGKPRIDTMDPRFASGPVFRKNAGWSEKQSDRYETPSRYEDKSDMMKGLFRRNIQPDDMQYGQYNNQYSNNGEQYEYEEKHEHMQYPSSKSFDSYDSYNNQCSPDYSEKPEFYQGPKQVVPDIFSLTRHNRYEQVEQLLDTGIPVDAQDRYGNTILTIACQNGLKRIAKLLLRRGANINSQNYHGNTPLHYCYAYNYGDSLGTYLISKGANPMIRNARNEACHEANLQ